MCTQNYDPQAETGLLDTTGLVHLQIKLPIN